MDLTELILFNLNEIRASTIIYPTSAKVKMKEEHYLWLLSTVQNLNGIVQEQGNLIRLLENTKELKHKKEIPTVIEYKGKRYVYDPS